MKRNALLKKYGCVALAMILLILCASCTGSAPASSSQAASSAPASATEKASSEDKVGAEFILKAGHTVAADHPYQRGLEYLDQLLNERTDGKVRLEIYPSAQLGGERELFEGAQMGTVDLALGATAPLANFDKSFLVFDLPYLFDSREHAYRCLDGEFGNSKFEILKNSGMIGLAYWEAGFFPIATSKKTMNTPEDASGLNIRVMENELFMAWITAMGSNPVPMAFSEVFTAVQNGTVDGASVSIASIFTSKLYTVAPYLDRLDAIYSPLPLVVSKVTWDKLPAEFQDILREAAIEARDYEREYITNAEKEYIEQMQSEGTTVRDYTPAERKVWEDAVKPKIWGDYVGGKVLESDIAAIEAMK